MTQIQGHEGSAPVNLKLPSADDWKPQDLPIASIRVVPEYQSRALGTHLPTVNKYAKLMQAGVPFPPIKVAKVNRRLYVIGGFHRLGAATKLGRDTIKAVVASMSPEAAKFLSIGENIDHGKGLSRADKRKRVADYADNGFHFRPDGTRKSYREMEREIGGVTYGSIRKWLMERGIEGGEPIDPNDIPKPWSPRDIQNDSENLLEASSHISSILTLSFELEDAAALHELHRMVDGLAHGIATHMRGQGIDPLEI